MRSILFIILIIFIIPNSFFSYPTDVELFNNVTRIKVDLNENTTFKITQNYYKREIFLTITNPPKNLFSKLKLYQDNNIEKIEQISYGKTESYKFTVSIINFFYDYRVENGALFIAVGEGGKIIPLKTKKSVIFVPYLFKPDRYLTKLERLDIDKIISKHPIAEKFNSFIEHYRAGRFPKAQDIGRELVRENLDIKSKTTLKYLMAEVGFYILQERGDGCNFVAAKLKKLIRDNPEHPFNDRAAVYIYKCYKESQALDEVYSILNYSTKNFTESPFYYDFLYNSALYDIDLGDTISFRRKMGKIILYSNNQDLKYHAVDQLYRYHFKNNDLIEAYNTILDNYPESKGALKNNPYYLTAYGDALFYYEKFDKAREVYEKVIKLTPNKFLQRYIRVRVADTYLYQNKFDKAVEYYKKNSGITIGDSIGATLAKIRKSELLGIDKKDILKKFDIMYSAIREPVLMQELIFRKAQIHFYLGNYIDSYFDIRDLLINFPYTTLKTTAKEMIDRIIYSIYFSLFKKRDYVDIYQIYNDGKKWLTKHPEYYNLVYMIMISMSKLEQYRDLALLIDDVLKTSKKLTMEPLYIYYLSQAHLNLKNYYKAKQAVDYLIYRKPEFKTFPQYFIFLGDYYWSRKNIKRGIKNYDIALNMDNLSKKERIDKLYKLGRYYFKKSDYKKSLTYYSKLLNQLDKGEDKEEILLKVGQINYYSKKYPQALDHFKSFLTNYPNSKDSDEVRYRLGMTYFYLKDYKKGVSVLTSLLDENKDKKDKNFWVKHSEKMLEYQKYMQDLDGLKELRIKKKGEL